MQAISGFLHRELEYTLHHGKDEDRPLKDKAILAIITMLHLGICGIDRCFMGQMVLGFCKMVTFGGFFVWAFVDYWVIVVNCLAGWKSIGVLGYEAKFEDGSIQTAFWVTLVLLAVNMVTTWGGSRRKEVILSVATPVSAPLAAGLRRNGLITMNPSVGEVKQIFSSWDKDGSGTIDKGELKEALEHLGVDSSEEAVAEIITKSDLDSDGKISVSELASVLSAK